VWLVIIDGVRSILLPLKKMKLGNTYLKNDASAFIEIKACTRIKKL
jgi:hypothetical protein